MAIERVPELIARIERVLAGAPELREALENSRDTLAYLRDLTDKRRAAENELERLRSAAIRIEVRQ